MSHPGTGPAAARASKRGTDGRAASCSSGTTKTGTSSDSRSTQIAIRSDGAELAALDAEVAAGRAANRSEAVRRSTARLHRQLRYQAAETTLLELARRGEELYPDMYPDSHARPPHPVVD